MPKLLIVDDEIESLKLMEKSLGSLNPNFSLFTANSGPAALAIAKREEPDMVLLDIRMDGMDGFETCEKLRSDDRTRLIPVIFITASDDDPTIVKAFKAGAVDYVIKPVRMQELLARITTHLDLEAHRRKVASYADQMECLAQERAKQLVHADRLATLGTLAAGIAQEVNRPATSIAGQIQTVERYWEEIKKLIHKHLIPDSDEAVKLEIILKEMPVVMGSMRSDVAQINRIVSGLKSYARQDEIQYAHVNLNDCIDQALMLCQSVLAAAGRVKKSIESDSVHIFGDPYQIIQVLVNFLTNAAHALEGRRDGVISILCQARDKIIELVIEDNGKGIPEKNIPKIWDPFFTTKEKGKGTGLGLAVAMGIIQRHGGRARVENKADGGVRFVIHLPQAV